MASEESVIIDVLGGAWGVITAFVVFVLGLLLMLPVARRFSVPDRGAILIYLWHTFFCVLYILYARSNTADANGYFYRSLEAGSMAVGTQFVTAFSSLFTRFLGFSYLGVFLVFNWIGTVGVVAFYGALRKITLHSSRWIRFLTLVCVLLPSVNFWSAALGKDAIAFTSVALFLWSALDFRRRVWICFLAGLMMACVRPHMAALMIVAVAISVTISREVKPLTRFTLIVVSFAVSAYALPFAANYAGIEDAGEVAEYVEARQSTNLGGGSSIDISSMSFPVQVFTFLFRPLPYEARGASSLIVAADNMFLLSLVASAVFLLAKRWRVLWRTRLMRVNTSMLLVYALAATSVLAMVTANLGIAVRQKWMVMPVLIYLAFHVMALRQTRYR